MQIITYYDLKPGVDPEEFLDWARRVDQPACMAMGACKSIETFHVLGGNRQELPTIVELVEATSFDEWEAATSSAAHKDVMRQWNEFAIAESVVSMYGTA